MRSVPTTCILLALATAAGCGDDGTITPDAPAVTAADFNGTWVMSSITIPDNGSTLTLRRDGVAQSIRGDVIFTATSETTGTLDVRQVALVQGLMASDVTALVATIAVEPEPVRWVLTEPSGGVVVFTVARTRDHMVLTRDAADPRNTSTDPPDEIIVDRVTPWTTHVVGTWALTSITLPGQGMVLADTCIAAGPSTWMKVNMAIDFSQSELFTRAQTTTSYSNDTCTTQTGTSTSTQTGFAEEEGGATLRLWGVEGASREYQVFAFTEAGDVVTLHRTECLPLPDCTLSAPTEVVVHRTSR